MPKGPKGQKRPADVVGNAVCVMKIATGGVGKQMRGLKDIDYVLGKLAWMRAERIWPND